MGKEGVTGGPSRRPRGSRRPGDRQTPRRVYSDRDPEVTILPPAGDDEPDRVDWRRLAPALLIGTCGGFLASLAMGGGGLLRHAVTGFLGLILGGAVLRALGLSLAVGNPIVAQIVTATIGAGAVIIIARILA